MENIKEIFYDITSEIEFKFFEFTQDYNTVLIADFDGSIKYGSMGRDDCEFMYLKTCEYFLYSTPFSLLYDLRDLEYEFGNSIMRIFDVTQNINFGDVEHLVPTTLVLSEKCLKGFSSLLAFDINKMPEWIFTDFDSALKSSSIKAKEYSEI